MPTIFAVWYCYTATAVIVLVIGIKEHAPLVGIIPALVLLNIVVRDIRRWRNPANRKTQIDHWW